MLSQEPIKDNPKLRLGWYRYVLTRFAGTVLLLLLSISLYNMTSTWHGQPKLSATPRDISDLMTSLQLLSRPPRALLPLATRKLIGSVLELDGATVGIELGVKKGEFAQIVLSQWPSCERYILVDIWKQQGTYVDIANVDNKEQEEYKAEALRRVEPWKEKVEVWQMYTTEAAAQLEDNSVDFVYIDARHDYCAVAEDLDHFWPKLKRGGIFSGHDFLYNSEVQSLTPDQDWGLCENGERNDRAVRGAVEDFADKHGLTVTISFRDTFRSWFIRKP